MKSCVLRKRPGNVLHNKKRNVVQRSYVTKIWTRELIRSHLLAKNQTRKQWTHPASGKGSFLALRRKLKQWSRTANERLISSNTRVRYHFLSARNAHQWTFPCTSSELMISSIFSLFMFCQLCFSGFVSSFISRIGTVFMRQRSVWSRI